MGSYELTMKTCFVIMPFSDPPGYESGHFLRVFNALIAPACERAGLTPIRADSVASSSVIMLDVIRNVVSADVVLCDLSSSNPNVVYELGIRHAAQKPPVVITDERTKDIFDLTAIRVSRYSSKAIDDLQNPDVERIRRAILDTVRWQVNTFFSLVTNLGHALGLSRVRVYAKRIDLTGDEGLKEVLAECGHLDIIGLAAEAAVMVFRENLLAALARDEFTSRFVIYDPSPAPNQSIHYEALVQNTLGHGAALKRTQAQEVLRLAREVTTQSRNPRKMEVRVIRDLPLLYNLWIAKGFDGAPKVGHLSVYAYDQKMGGPAFRSTSMDSPLLATLQSEFNYVWNQVSQPVSSGS